MVAVNQQDGGRERDQAWHNPAADNGFTRGGGVWIQRGLRHVKQLRSGNSNFRGLDEKKQDHGNSLWGVEKTLRHPIDKSDVIVYGICVRFQPPPSAFTNWTLAANCRV